MLAAIGLTLAVGYGLTMRRWGPEGVEAMWAAAVICSVSSVLGAIPVYLAARLSPTNVGQMAFAGTAIRLLAAGALAGAYQMMASLHLKPFLSWMVVLYLLLLVIDTTFGVLLVRRYHEPAKSAGRS